MITRMSELEQWLFNVLTEYADHLPPRWKRWLAMYYPDARIRKIFWQKTCVVMGEGTFANPGVVVVDDYSTGECLLFIGNHVSIAPCVIFVAYSYPTNSPAMLAHPYVAQNLIQRMKIVVEDDVWIGANATILPGVHIGRGAIIGAGTVLHQNVPPYTIVAGVPARFIGRLEPLPNDT